MIYTYAILGELKRRKGLFKLNNLDRITIDPGKMGGVPCIRHLRIPVATVVGSLADGMTQDEVLEAYPDLEAEDISAALRFAAWAVLERELPLRKAA